MKKIRREAHMAFTAREAAVYEFAAGRKEGARSRDIIALIYPRGVKRPASANVIASELLRNVAKKLKINGAPLALERIGFGRNGAVWILKKAVA